MRSNGDHPNRRERSAVLSTAAAERVPAPSRAATSGWARVLDSISDVEREKILGLAVTRRFDRGEIVFHEGDPGEYLHIVIRGVFIARSSSTMGELITVNIFTEGDAFGELTLLAADAHRSATVVSMRSGATLALARSHFDAIRDEDPRVDRFLVSVLAERNRRLNEQLIELLFTPVQQRVCRRLLAFADVVGPSTDGWLRLNQA